MHACAPAPFCDSDAQHPVIDMHHAFSLSHACLSSSCMLSITILDRSKAHTLQILALPAKRVGFFAAEGALIARSDSNGEDLEAFAGAGETL